MSPQATAGGGGGVVLGFLKKNKNQLVPDTAGTVMVCNLYHRWRGWRQTDVPALLAADSALCARTSCPDGPL